MRNVEDDMFYGRSTMLKDVLNFFIDYGIKTNGEYTKDEKEKKLKETKNNFGDEASTLMTSFLRRLSDGKDVMLDYAHETGASFNNALPDFKLCVQFSEGVTKIYDVKPLFERLSNFSFLKECQEKCRKTYGLKNVLMSL